MHNHLMVGTRKGIFIYSRSSSGWELKNKGFLGSEVNIATFDSRDNSIYACLHLGHFGSKIHSSRDGGVSWAKITCPAYPSKTGRCGGEIESYGRNAATMEAPENLEFGAWTCISTLFAMLRNNPGGTVQVNRLR